MVASDADPCRADCRAPLYRISIEWHELEEPAGASILGALDPGAGTIALNSRHERLLSEVLGPYEFTLGHELGHWLFDAVAQTS